LALDFDFSGQYLAMGGSNAVRVVGTKEWQVVATWADATAPVTGVKWGANVTCFVLSRSLALALALALSLLLSRSCSCSCSCSLLLLLSLALARSLFN
jgi:hypothetical protein